MMLNTPPAPAPARGVDPAMAARRVEPPVLPTGAFRRSSRLLALPMRHAARTVAAATRLSSATAEQISARSATQVFTTLGELKGGAAKLGQALSIFEAALPEEVAGPYRSALIRLTDATPAMPAAVAHRVLAADLSFAYGKDWRQRLVDFDDTPAARRRSAKSTAGAGVTTTATSSMSRSRCSTPASPRRCARTCAPRACSAASWPA
jgi:hypothetical protein